MSNTLLIVNSGSSSVKLALYDALTEQLLTTALAERLGTTEARLVIKQPDSVKYTIPSPGKHQQAIQEALTRFKQAGFLEQIPAGIGHRVVHGGEAFTQSARIDASTLTTIEKCIPLAPLHNPANLAGIQALQELFPKVPQVAVFDTAFHQSMTPTAYLYALPYALYEQQGIRRYGFHGTSHRFITQELANRLEKPAAATSLICAHLGNGCSITAIHNGKSVDTSMGFTPLEGLVMGTRSGDIDPGLFDFMIGLGYQPEGISHLLNRESGLLGISGLSNDMRTLEQAASQGHVRAALAIDIFCFRLARYVGAMMASLQQLDGLVFTGGIGENSPHIRAKTLQHLSLLGFRLDHDSNRSHGQNRLGRIDQGNSHPIWVIPTNEELLIARDTRALI